MNQMTREKVMQYAKYRWPYSTDACQFIIETADVSQGVVADVGAGTGLLTQHFVGKVKKVFAIEPELEMRNFAHGFIGDRQDIDYIDGVAENTTLESHSVDLIIAANAYHRFQPEPTLNEFRRILKPNGMLAVFSYHDEHNFVRDTLRVCNNEHYNQRLTATRHEEPVQYFYGDAISSRYLFTQEQSETWDDYWGAIGAGMESPDESEEWFITFQEAHRQRFNDMATSGRITVKYSTEVWLGQPNY